MPAVDVHDTTQRTAHGASNHGYPAHSQNGCNRPFLISSAHPRPLHLSARRWHRKIQLHCWRWNGCQVCLSNAQSEPGYVGRRVRIVARRSKKARLLPEPAPNEHHFAEPRKTICGPLSDTFHQDHVSQSVQREWYYLTHRNHLAFRSFPFQSAGHVFANRVRDGHHNGRSVMVLAMTETLSASAFAIGELRQMSWLSGITCRLPPARAEQIARHEQQMSHDEHLPATVSYAPGWRTIPASTNARRDKSGHHQAARH
ncbi:hypothetical protein D3C75_479740 [compost metagenome]